MADEIVTPEAPRSRSHILRRGLLALLLIVVIMAGVLHARGAGTTVIIAVVAAVALGGYLLLRHLPRIRHHLNDGRRPRQRRMRRTRTTRTITRGQKGGMRGRLAGMKGRLGGGRAGGTAGGRKAAGAGGSGRKGLARLNPFSGKKGPGGAGSRSGRHSAPKVPGGAGARGKRTLRHPLGGGRNRAGGAGTGRRASGTGGRRRSGAPGGAKTGRRSFTGRRGGPVPGFPGGRPGMRHPAQRRQYRRSQKAQNRASRAARRAAAAAPAALGGAPKFRRARAAGRFLRHPTSAGRQRATAARLARGNRKAGKSGSRQVRKNHRAAMRQNRKDARVMAAQGRKTARNAARAAAGGRMRHARRLRAWGGRQGRRAGTYGRTSARRAWTGLGVRQRWQRRHTAKMAERYPAGVPPLGQRLTDRWDGRTPLRARLRAWRGRGAAAAVAGARLAGSLLFWRRRRRNAPAYWTRPPEAEPASAGPRADPEDGRMPAPAEPTGTAPRIALRSPAEHETERGGHMAGGVIHQAAEEFARTVGAYRPSGPTEMIGTFDGLPDAFGELGSGVQGLISLAESEMPLGPATTQGMQDMMGIMASLRSQAEEVARTFRAEHEQEISRVEQPRPAEELWDVSQDQ